MNDDIGQIMYRNKDILLDVLTLRVYHRLRLVPEDDVNHNAKKNEEHLISYGGLLSRRVKFYNDN